MTDVTKIIEILVNLVAVAVSVVLIPYIKEKLSASKLKTVQGWIEIAVNAAEEAARSGLIEKGAKYSYAVELLEKRGITFDAATTQALIDSTVWQLLNQFKDESAEECSEKGA